MLQLLHWQERTQLARRKVKSGLLGFCGRQVVFRGVKRQPERKLLLTLTLAVDEIARSKLSGTADNRRP